MNTTKKAPNVPISDFKRVKILATIGPATNTYKAIYELIAAGANGIRLNFSHGTNEERIQQIKWIRKASKEYGKPVAIIQDLQGPKIRLGDFEGVIPVEEGQQLRFKYKSDFDRSGIIPTQYDLSKKVKRGERVMLYDGKVVTTVTSVKDGVVSARADNGGVLLKRKGINLPDTSFDGDTITAKDRKDASLGSTLDIDYVAQSFVQTSLDVKAMRRVLKNLGSRAKLISKIETQSALDDIGDIVDESDAIMVARGDLAVETSPEVVPIAQRKIIGICLAKSRPVIVATQMLLSMTESSEPTRAEVSDVATAVIVGADCLMLSEETAAGKYPVEAVKIMKRVIKYAESHSPVQPVFTMENATPEPTKQEAICRAVVSLAKEVDAKAIVAGTKSGATALQLASKRSDDPLIAVTSDPVVANQLAIVYGVKSYVRPDSKHATRNIADWLGKKNMLKKGDVIVTAYGKYPGVIGTTDSIKVRVF